MHPLIPYFTVSPLHLFGPLQVDFSGYQFSVGELSIKPFGTLVAFAVYLGTEIARREGERRKVDAKALAAFMLNIVVGGFIGGHVLDLIFYHPETVLASPLSLLRIWDGQSSFGGFTGSALGLIWWRLQWKRPSLPYADVVCSAFPAAWVFGRMGCAVAHDHPGMLSNAWFAVAYPGGGRFDLGLYECLLTIPLALTFLRLMRRPRPVGFYLAVACFSYAPVRFALDFLRARDLAGADSRYLGLTPAQWGCMVMLGAGTYLALGIRRARNQPTIGEAPPPAGDSTTSSAQDAGGADTAPAAKGADGPLASDSASPP